MKKILLLYLFLLASNIHSQTDLNIPDKFPTENGKFTFPLNSKILIELVESSNGKYEYRVLSIYPIKRNYSLDAIDSLFSNNPKENTIELFFIGENINVKTDYHWKTVLALKSNMNVSIHYKADIKYYNSSVFKNIDNVAIFPKVKTTEIWQQKIDYITLYDFEKIK